jgi:hypothetical protein
MRLRVVTDGVQDITAEFYSTKVPFGMVAGGTSKTVRLHLVNDVGAEVREPKLFLSGGDSQTITRTWTAIDFPASTARCGIYFTSAKSPPSDMTDMSNWTAIKSLTYKDAHTVPADAISSGTTTLDVGDYIDIYLRVLVPITYTAGAGVLNVNLCVVTYVG